MKLVIFLSKEVPDIETGQQLVNLVAERINDRPGITIQATLNAELVIPEPPD